MTCGRPLGTLGTGGGTPTSACRIRQASGAGGPIAGGRSCCRAEASRTVGDSAARGARRTRPATTRDAGSGTAAALLLTQQAEGQLQDPCPCSPGEDPRCGARVEACACSDAAPPDAVAPVDTGSCIGHQCIAAGSTVTRPNQSASIVADSRLKPCMIVRTYRLTVAAAMRRGHAVADWSRTTTTASRQRRPCAPRQSAHRSPRQLSLPRRPVRTFRQG